MRSGSRSEPRSRATGAPADPWGCPSVRAVVDQIAANCGAGARSLLTSGHPFLTPKVVMQISRTTPERQREELARVRRGERPLSKTAVFDTTGYPEVWSRLARAAGVVHKVASLVPRAVAAGALADVSRAGLGPTVDRLLDGCRDLWAVVRQALADPRAAGQPAAKEFRRGAPKDWGHLPATPDAAARAVGQLNAAVAFVEKCVRDLPRVPDRPVRLQFWPARGQAHAIGVRLFEMARNLLRVRECLSGGPSGGVARVVTHARPDPDALVAAWLAERFLFAGRRVEMRFVPYGFDWTRGPAADCLVDLGGLSAPDLGLFDHKPPARADRTETCAAELVREYLADRGQRVGGELAKLVVAVRDGDSPARRATSPTYAESRMRGLHAEVGRLKGLGMSDDVLYARTRAWLDRRFGRSDAPG